MSIQIKVISAFCAVIIPFFIVSVAVNNISSRVITDQISQSLMSELRFYTSQLENEVRHIRTIHDQHYGDRDLIMLSLGGNTLGNYERYLHFRNLYDKLIMLKRSSIFVDKVRVYIPMVGVVVSSDIAITRMEDYEFEAAKALSDKYSYPMLISDGRIYICTSYINYKNIFLTELSSEELRLWLSRFEHSQQFKAVLISQTEDFFISHEGDEELSVYVMDMMSDAIGSSTQSGVKPVAIDGNPYQVAYFNSEYLKMTLLVYFDESDILAPISRFRPLIGILLALSVVAIVWFTYLINKTLHIPLHKLMNSFKKVDEGELDVSIEHTGKDEFGYIYSYYNTMLEKLQELIKNLYQQRYLTMQAELQGLHSQINTHFLYNSLFIIYRTAQDGDAEKAAEMSYWLANYFMIATKSQENDITLRQEVNHTTAYLEIQRIRFSGRIEVEFEPLPESLEDILVPKLIIQPIVENAYIHGLKNKEENGHLRISINSSDGALIIDVEDNGDELCDSVLEELRARLCGKHGDPESSGLMNVHRRIQLSFGTESGLSVSRSSLGGLKTSIRMNYGGEWNNVQITDN